MSPATANAAIDLAAASGQPFHVQFAGGEPTLNPDVMVAVCNRIARDRLPATVAVQTNAVGITPRLVGLFQEHRVQVGVSIDGPPGAHEQVRGRAADTYAGLELLAASDVPVRVTCVLTAVNATRLAELAMLLAGYPNVTGLALDPLVPLGSAHGRRDLVPDPAEVALGVAALHVVMDRLARLRGTPFAWRELDTVRRALRADRARPTPLTLGPRPDDDAVPRRNDAAYCHAALGQSLAVAPDGRVYPCSQSVGEPRRAAGTVHDVDWAALHRQFRRGRLTGPCVDCALQGRCPGDCPSRLEAAESTGVPPESVHLACLIYRTIADRERTRS